jgi:hypothetical protein
VQINAIMIDTRGSILTIADSADSYEIASWMHSSAKPHFEELLKRGIHVDHELT